MITEYAYDAENVRISEQTGSSRSEFVTDRESEYSRVLTEEISEKNRLGLFRVKEEKTYTYGNGLLGEYRRRTDERLYYHFDNLGSTLKVTGSIDESR